MYKTLTLFYTSLLFLPTPRLWTLTNGHCWFEGGTPITHGVGSVTQYSTHIRPHTIPCILIWVKLIWVKPWVRAWGRVLKVPLKGRARFGAVSTDHPCSKRLWHNQGNIDCAKAKGLSPERKLFPLSDLKLCPLVSSAWGWDWPSASVRCVLGEKYG